jgi:hypothetical protein
MKRRIGFVIALLCTALASLQIVDAETLTVTNRGDAGGGTHDLFLDTVMPHIGPNVNVSREHLNESETQIAVNPANPLNLFAVSNHDYEHLTPPEGEKGVLGRYSTDGGRTWQVPDPPVGRFGPPASLDPGVVFDKFGNLFVSYKTAEPGEFFAVVISTDGGQHLTDFRRIGDEGVDFDNLAVGPAGRDGGQGGNQALWVSYASGPNVRVVHAELRGLGEVGPFSPPTTVERPAGVKSANFGNIAVGPHGQVAVTFMDSSKPRQGPGDIYVAVDPDGVGPRGFGTAQRVTSSNWGWSVPVPSAYNYRQTSAVPFLAYDNSSGPFIGRLYLSYLDSPEVWSPHSYVNLRYLDDGATSWSPPVRVSTGAGNLGTAFMPSISVDPTSGLVGATWYDSDAVGGNLANLFAAFSDTGGQTFSQSVRLSEKSSRADRSNPTDSNTHQGYGDYVRNAFYDRVFYASWADNSNSTRDNPDGETYLDLYTVRVDFSPRPPLPPP